MSEQQGHTPGPWTVDLKNTFECRVPVVRDSRGMMVARTSGLLIHSETELEANARLIAAAPDLLDACEAALIAQLPEGAYCFCCQASLVDGEEHSDICPMPGIQAAVAKARGD